MKTAIIIHRWGGNPKSDWYPWIKKQLAGEGYKMLVPAMPDTDSPNMHAWISALNAIIPNPTRETMLIGHSIGCQTILRWMSMLPEEKKVGKVILVAPWMKLQGMEGDEKSQAIALPWVETPIAWEKVLAHGENFTCIFSDNDPFVAVSQSKLFEEKLHAKIIIEKKQGHFDEDSNVREMHSVLNSI